MSKKQKLLDKFLRNPISKTLTFDELETLLISLGFEKIDGAGSRIKFFNKEKDSLINLHNLIRVKF
ncbi:hypothetical protein BSPWISOXPB_5643 [uncultured Gammaproteobacteria bacterium]|nr:hypothetical protein BSPWISOXPB_5643 [uncultured Gammaproteobacteria bacterium]